VHESRQHRAVPTGGAHTTLKAPQMRHCTVSTARLPMAWGPPELPTPSPAVCAARSCPPHIPWVSATSPTPQKGQHLHPNKAARM
jgi:hypothetical protein